MCRAASGAPDQPGDTVTTAINGLEIVLDGRSGSILSLSHAGPGKMLETTPEHASILDLAYPVPQFEPLRLASRFSTGARITKASGQVAIRWDRLGASRTAFAVPGRVSATVTLKAAPDGKSIILACRVENRSENAVRQILFPDLFGLVPFGGVSQTEFRSGGAGGAVIVKPFQSLAKPEQDQFYAVNSTFAQYTSSGKDSQAIGRWMLLGTQQAGLAPVPPALGLGERADRHAPVPRDQRSAAHDVLPLRELTGRGHVGKL